MAGRRGSIVCRFQVPICGENCEDQASVEKCKLTPRIHSRYKSSTRLRWCAEPVDEVAARARRVGIVVIVSDNLRRRIFPEFSTENK